MASNFLDLACEQFADELHATRQDRDAYRELLHLTLALVRDAHQQRDQLREQNRNLRDELRTLRGESRTAA